MRILILGGALLALAGTMPAEAAARAPKARTQAAADVEALLAADRAAGRASAAAPGLAALEAMFADDVVMFAVPVPRFAVGKAAARAALERALGTGEATSRWVPIRGGISADGTHGFTFGYMTSEMAGKPPQLAKYVSYWSRTGEAWRVRLFKRVPRPEGEVSLTTMPPSLPDRRLRWRTGAKSLAAAVESLRAREQFFSDISQRIGLSAAFGQLGASDAVNVGGDSEFVVGASEIAKVLPATSPLRWSADQGVLAAPSGDLGVTWGYLHRTGPVPPGRLAEIPFFTIWRRSAPGAPWYYVAE